jgi:hypothetical protein
MGEAMSMHPISKLIIDSLILDPPRGYDVDPTKTVAIMNELSDPAAGPSAMCAFYETVGMLTKHNGKQAATTLLELAMAAIDAAPSHRAAAGWGART